MEDSSKQLGVMAILREAFTLPFRNKKLMLPVMLLSVLPSSLLLIGNYVSIHPLLTNLIIKLYSLTKRDPSSPQFSELLLGIKTDVQAIVDIDSVFTAIIFLVSMLSQMMVIYASAMTYSSSTKPPTPLDIFTKMRKTWKGVFATKIYFTLLYIGYTVLSIFVTTVLMLNANGRTALIGIGTFVALAAHLVYVYLSMVWMMGVVISVLEEDCYGLEALGKAGELVKGRRVRGFILAFMLMVGYGVLTGSYAGVGLSMSRPQLEAQKATGFVVINLMLMLKMYSEVVFTVFYFECVKKKQGREGEVVGEVAYTKVPEIHNEDV